MECPKCKKEMHEFKYGNAFGSETKLVCENKDCWFYGIWRNKQ